MRRKAEKQVELCENRVMQLEADKAALEEKLSTPEGSSDAKLFEQYADIGRQLKKAEEDWEEALLELETL